MTKHVKIYMKICKKKNYMTRSAKFFVQNIEAMSTYSNVLLSPDMSNSQGTVLVLGIAGLMAP